jgi:hypothetical protein
MFVVLILLVGNGCKQNNTVAHGTAPTLSVSNVKDSILYTFVIPKTVFGINDTLSAALTLYNQSISTDTLTMIVGSLYYSGLWTLKDERGKTFMDGPKIIPLTLTKVLLASHQSLSDRVIYQVFADSSGALLVAGSYILQEQIFSVSLTLNISLQ